MFEVNLKQFSVSEFIVWLHQDYLADVAYRSGASASLVRVKPVMATVGHYYACANSERKRSPSIP